ncbi:MAG: IS4 family transposase [Dissulfuribacterales bacterium]
MPRSFKPYRKKFPSPAFYNLYQPIKKILPGMPLLESRGDRPLQMTFEDQLKALIFFHLEEHVSARHLVQVLQEDDFARKHIVPKNGIGRSSFSEAINSRGLEQLEIVFQKLSREASNILPHHHADLGEIVAIDGSLIDAVLSMTWADYRKGSKKAKIHVGFNLNQAIPTRIFLTDGKRAERPFVSQILLPGQTGVGDRGYQDNALFDFLQTEGKNFVIRIKANTTKTPVQKYDVNPESIVFYDAEVLLGTPGSNQTEKPVRVVGYRVDNEPVSIKRVRELRIQIQNEIRNSCESTGINILKEQKRYRLHAKT